MVCTWNLFHGRTQPPTHRDLVAEFAAALGEYPWAVCGLQEVPPWWANDLAGRLGASSRSARTSLVRASLPRLQELVHRRDPEVLGARGAGANVLLVRPAAGAIVDHRTATLRWLPQRRSVHAVRLRRADGTHWWVANAHTHNRPESAAAADAVRAMGLVAGWAGAEPAVLLGDLNLPTPQGLAAVEGWEHLHGHRVDHVLGRGVNASGPSFAATQHLQSGGVLADHRVVGLALTDC